MKVKPLDVIIENAESILLSANDILEQTKNQVNILVYEDLLKLNSIDEAFDGKPGLVLLYQNSRNSGHWCLLFKTGRNTIYFFDSYGIPMDSEIKWSRYLVNQGFLQQPALSYLIKKSSYKLLQNTVRYQTLIDGSSTCGRWCIIRFNYRDMSDKDFKTYMLGNKHYNGDFFCTLLTM